MAEAKNTLLALVARVERGEQIAITRRGPRNRGSGGSGLGGGSGGAGCLSGAISGQLKTLSPACITNAW
ncbi:MAG: hypothetical protein VKN56_07195 [Cyanobacteriota bacterium]|nr:hypothetical protein [Cyanobacteriota bacterium]